MSICADDQVDEVLPLRDIHQITGSIMIDCSVLSNRYLLKANECNLDFHLAKSEVVIRIVVVMWYTTLWW